MELDLAAAAVEDDGDARLRRIARLDVMRRAAARHAEALQVNVLGRHAELAQRRLDLVEHAPGPQTNASSMESTGSSVGEGLHLGGVEAAVEQLDVLMLAAEQVVEGEARRDSGPSGPPAPPGTSTVARRRLPYSSVKRLRLALERGLDQREHRRDAAAGGESRRSAWRCPASGVKASLRREHVDGVAGLKALVRAGGERPPGTFLIATRSSASSTRRRSNRSGAAPRRRASCAT